MANHFVVNIQTKDKAILLQTRKLLKLPTHSTAKQHAFMIKIGFEINSECDPK